MDLGSERAGLPDDVIAPPMTRAVELFGVGSLEVVFPDRGSGPSPTAVTPWPTAARGRGGLYDRDLVRGALLNPPSPRLVDPRVLWCSQPGLTWAGVRHYLEDDRYARTGETWADRDDVGNLRPVVYLRPSPTGLRAIILSGHHRSAAALITGGPIMAVVVGAPADTHARMVTERLLVGATSPLDHEVVGDPADAVELIGVGRRALVADRQTAEWVLELLGVEPRIARWRVDRALGVDHESHDAAVPSAPS